MSPDDTLHGEDEIIALLRPLAGEGALDFKDDCALLKPQPGTELVLKTDPIAEGIHFLSEDAPEDIAWKALAVNVSDLAAKAARPLAYMMALSFPEAPARSWMIRFAQGLSAAQAAFGMTLLGGDTDRRPGPLTVSVTVIGEVAADAMVRRATAQAGDLLFVSGTIGDAALGLRLCQSHDIAGAWSLTPAEVQLLCARYRRPAPRLALASALRNSARAAMDVSDGLLKDAERMAKASGTTATIDLARVPLSAPASKVVAIDQALLMRLASGGDDYEILAAVPPEAAAEFQSEAQKAGVPVSEVGLVAASGTGLLRVLDLRGNDVHVQSGGWDHFDRKDA